MIFDILLSPLLPEKDNSDFLKIISNCHNNIFILARYVSLSFLSRSTFVLGKLRDTDIIYVIKEMGFDFSTTRNYYKTQ